MGHPDDDDRTVYLEYHEAEIRERDALIAAYRERVKQATDILEEALCLADEWTNARWLKDVENWLTRERKL